MSSFLRSILPKSSAQDKRSSPPVTVSAERDSFECQLTPKPMSSNPSLRNIFSPRRKKQLSRANFTETVKPPRTKSKGHREWGTKISVQKNLTLSSSTSVANTSVETKPLYNKSQVEKNRIEEEPPRQEETLVAEWKKEDPNSENQSPGEKQKVVIEAADWRQELLCSPPRKGGTSKTNGVRPSASTKDEQEAKGESSAVVDGVLALADSIDKYLEDITEQSLKEKDDCSVEASSEKQSKTSKKCKQSKTSGIDAALARELERIAAQSPITKTKSTRSDSKPSSRRGGVRSFSKSLSKKSSKKSRRRGKKNRVHRERIVRIRWRDTSPDVQRRWLLCALEAIQRAKRDDNSTEVFSFHDDDDTANRLAKGARVVGNREIQYVSNSIAHPLSQDDMSLSSLDVLFHWLTCRKVLSLPESRGGQRNLSGMVIDAVPSESPLGCRRHDDAPDVFSILDDFDDEYSDGNIESDDDLFDFGEEPGPEPGPYEMA